MQPDRVTVRQALVRAIWMIMVPSMTLLAVPWAVVLIATTAGAIPDEGGGSSVWGWALLVSILAGWLAWSIQVPKWRLWAYERVDDVQLLKARAIEAQLIWSDSSIFTRTEIASRETWSRIRELEAKGTPWES